MDLVGERLRWKPALAELVEQAEVAPDQIVEVTVEQWRSRRMTQLRVGHRHRLCWGQEDAEQSSVSTNLVVASEPGWAGEDYPSVRHVLSSRQPDRPEPLYRSCHSQFDERNSF